ncbi:MAG: DUF6273 domain-containing protein [Erysipelotrichaceae bacterium]|jgi:hypothetical protein|nr:DUF6273 domain-containing protein [Erysipelotrichaceae bacterium]
MVCITFTNFGTNESEDEMKRSMTTILGIGLSILSAVLIGVATLQNDNFQTKTNSDEITNTNATTGLIPFGSYPQSVVDQEVCADVIQVLDEIQTTNSRGYLEYNGAEYERVIPTPVVTNPDEPTFDDGSIIHSNMAYYFKVEPIMWRLLDPNSGLLVSEMLLEGGLFDDDSGDWETSMLRDYLNTTFYQKAFDAAEKELLGLTDYPISDGNNPTNTSTTADYVTLLTAADYENEAYGFATDTSRVARVTEYALATGIEYRNMAGFGYTGSYYTRTKIPVPEYSIPEDGEESIITISAEGGFSSYSLTFMPPEGEGSNPRIAITIPDEFMPELIATPKIIGYHTHGEIYVNQDYQPKFEFEILDPTITSIYYQFVSPYRNPNGRFLIQSNMEASCVLNNNSVVILEATTVVDGLDEYYTLMLPPFLPYSPKNPITLTDQFYDVLIVARNANDEVQIIETDLYINEYDGRGHGRRIIGSYTHGLYPNAPSLPYTSTNDIFAEILTPTYESVTFTLRSAFLDIMQGQLIYADFFFKFEAGAEPVMAEHQGSWPAEIEDMAFGPIPPEITVMTMDNDGAVGVKIPDGLYGTMMVNWNLEIVAVYNNGTRLITETVNDFIDILVSIW